MEKHGLIRQAGGNDEWLLNLLHTGRCYDVYNAGVVKLKSKVRDESVKNEEEARIQYTELASALEQVGASWVVVEVEEVIARGKTVLFRELSEEDAVLYESRLEQESLRGLSIGRARAGDSIGVPYSADEQLGLLVAAAERIVMISEYSMANIYSFASRLGISDIRLESPVDPYANSATGSEARNIPLTPPSLVGERLSILHSVLYGEVLG